ncbi:MAG: TonB-dependent receptor [Candidatus Latescibacteria bacterium]|nr:TonB-dependent receptor [Candidatus Latescibacterota bacterium]
MIRDAENGDRLYSVGITLLKNNRGTYTDENGSFSFTNVSPVVDTLVCRLIGYRELRHAVTIPGIVELNLEPEPVKLDGIEVRAVRPDDLPPHERTSASVNVITREDIPDRKATIAEILDNQVGIDVRSLGGVGAKSEVSIRGSTTGQVAVYVDGIPVTAEGSGVSGLSMVPLAEVDNIEVYRGASPGTFGSGAIGGVVNISTIKPEHAFGTSVSTSYGSFGTNHQTLSAQISFNENNRLAFSLGRHASKNDFRYLDNRGTTTDTSDDDWETRANNDYNSSHFLANWYVDLNPSHSIKTKISFSETEKGVSGLGRRPALHARLTTDNLLLQSKYSFRNQHDVLAWVSKHDQGFYDPEDEAGRRGRQDSHSDIDVMGIITRHKYVYGPALFHAQFELKNEQFTSKDDYYSSVTLPSERIHGGGGVEAEIMLAGGNMWLNPRIHYVRVDDKLQDLSTFLVGTSVDSTMSADRDIFTYALGGRYSISPSCIMRMNIGYYPRVPEFNELFGDTGDIVGNPQLKEEKSTNADAGFHYTGTKLPVEIDVTGFYRYATDLIQRQNFGDYLLSENIGKAQVTGIESWISGYIYHKKLFYRTSLAYQKALNKSDETVFRKNRYYNKLLPYHPEWMSDTTIRYRLFEWVSTAWKMSYESECFKGPSNLPEEVIESRIIHDVELSFNTGRNIMLNLGINNIGDDQASDRWGYPKPGRSYYVGLKWNYERDNE